MAQEQNWARTYTYRATHTHHPRTIDDVRRIVAGATNIRAVGTRHSFNAIADSPGEMIDLDEIPPDFELDRARSTVTVGAATRYGVLARYLQGQGLALHNMGSLPHISVAGATATGTHGSGDGNGNLSKAIAALELVTATGDLVRVRRGDDNLDGMVVGLGTFGVVTRVTVDVQPSFNVRQDAFANLPWSVVLSDLDSVMSSAYSVSLMTKWSTATVGRLWLKTRVSDQTPMMISAAHLQATPVAPSVALGDSVSGGELTEFGTVGPWCERLPHFRLDRDPGASEQIQSEYMVPRAQAMTALASLHAIGDRIDENLMLTEIRTMAADHLWLSPSYGHDTVAIHFTWHKRPEVVAAMTREIEDLLLPLGARPHWGKLMHARVRRLAPLYPKLPAFRSLAQSYDPGGKFRNEFLAAHVFG